MASDTTKVGAYGEIEIIVTLVSQSQGGNTSNIRVRCVMNNNGNSSSFGSASVTITGTSSWSDSSVSFSVPAYGSDTVADQTFTEPHNSDGYLTASYTFKLGSTGTYTFGSGGSVNVSYTAPRIPKKPDTPKAPTLALTPPQTVKVTWTAPDSNGDSIDTYYIQYADNSSFTSAAIEPSSTDMVENIGGLAIGKTWYFRLSAKNGVGTSAYSAASSIAIPGPPDVCPPPTLEFTPPTTVKVTWTAPASIGAAITGYDVQYATDTSFTTPITVSTTDTTTTVTDITAGTTWYFRVRAKNSQGIGQYGQYTAVNSYAGPRVRVGGVWTPTIAYVRVAGVWKTAIPYVRVNGVWKVGGG